MSADPRIARNRERKARRYVDYFIAQMRGSGILNPEADKAALEQALAKVRTATPEQWARAAKENEDRPPSAETLLLIVREFEQKIAQADEVKARARVQAKEDAELINELIRQRVEGASGYEEGEG